MPKTSTTCNVKVDAKKTKITKVVPSIKKVVRGAKKDAEKVVRGAKKNVKKDVQDVKKDKVVRGVKKDKVVQDAKKDVRGAKKDVQNVKKVVRGAKKDIQDAKKDKVVEDTKKVTQVKKRNSRKDPIGKVPPYLNEFILVTKQNYAHYKTQPEFNYYKPRTEKHVWYYFDPRCYEPDWEDELKAVKNGKVDNCAVLPEKKLVPDTNYYDLDEEEFSFIVDSSEEDDEMDESDESDESDNYDSIDCSDECYSDYFSSGHTSDESEEESEEEIIEESEEETDVLSEGEMSEEI